jgi:PEP-CTERM/exosortase A-associated glycosyltransferase
VLDGYSQRSRSIIAAQLEQGFSPLVLTSPLHRQDDPSASDTLLDGIHYLRTPDPLGLPGRAIRGRWPILRELSIVQALRRRTVALLKNQAFDIVHAHSPALCGLAASQAARSCGVPFVYEIRAFWEDGAVHGNKMGQRSFRYRLARNLETHVVTRADAVVGIARSILDDLKARRIPAEKLFHVPNGVDISRFSPRQRDTRLSATLDLGEVPTLGFLGTLFPWEGISWLVRAAAELHKRGFVFKLLIVGDGAEASEIEKIIRQTQVQGYVYFLGRVPHEQVASYYSLMDVLVYPRRRVRLTELVTPLKPLEAMALGKAILASNVGGLRELIEPDITGALFEPENIEDFCLKVGPLLLDEKLRTRLGENARRRVGIEKNWSQLACRYELVYDTAIKNARLRAGVSFDPK